MGLAWTPQWVALAVGWTTLVVFLCCVAGLRTLPYRRRQLIGYAIVVACLLPLWWTTRASHLWDWDLISGEVLVCDYIIFFGSKAFLLRRTSWLGQAMAYSNWALGLLFAASQIWLVWDGGRVEFYMMMAIRVLLAVTVNDAQAALLEPPPPFKYAMHRDSTTADFK